jgi:hypothetical protein
MVADSLRSHHVRFIIVNDGNVARAEHKSGCCFVDERPMGIESAGSRRSTRRQTETHHRLRSRKRRGRTRTRTRKSIADSDRARVHRRGLVPRHTRTELSPLREGVLERVFAFQRLAVDEDAKDGRRRVEVEQHAHNTFARARRALGEASSVWCGAGPDRSVAVVRRADT